MLDEDRFADEALLRPKVELGWSTLIEMNRSLGVSGRYTEKMGWA